MPGLSYPFVYECEQCGQETIVGRPEARDAYPLNPNSLNPPDVVLEQRGWVRQKDRTLLCPDCASGLD